jgi:hypothetical protein
MKENATQIGTCIEDPINFKETTISDIRIKNTRRHTKIRKPWKTSRLLPEGVEPIFVPMQLCLDVEKIVQKTHSRCESRNANIVDVHHLACSKCSTRYYPAYVLTLAAALARGNLLKETTHQSKMRGCSNCNAYPTIRQEKRTAYRNVWELATNAEI